MNDRINKRGSLVEIGQELRRQVEARHDVVLDTSTMEVDIDQQVVRTREYPMGVKSGPNVLRLIPLTAQSKEHFPTEGCIVNEHALPQFAGRVTDGGIPMKFFRRMLQDNPKRLRDLVNGLLQDHPQRRFIRTLDGRVRAFLSNSYLVIDSLFVAEQIFRATKECGAKILKASLSDTHFRCELISPEIFEAFDSLRQTVDDIHSPGGGLGAFSDPEHLRRLSLGEFDFNRLPDPQAGPSTVWPVVSISNSDVGCGAFNGDIGIMQPSCLNLAISSTSVRRVHLGSTMETGIYKQDTIVAEQIAIQKKIRDAIGVAFDRDAFEKLCESIRPQTEKVVESPSSAVENVIGLTTDLSESDGNGLLDLLVSHQTGCGVGREKTVYDVGQAVARFAQTQDSDREAALQSFAGEIVSGTHNSALLAV